MARIQSLIYGQNKEGGASSEDETPLQSLIVPSLNRKRKRIASSSEDEVGIVGSVLNHLIVSA